jgi:Zn-dependent M28 family amino/carboxypeptidase
MKRRFIAVLVALIATLAVASTASAAPRNNTSAKLRKAVTLEGIRDHQAAFQAIADANGGTRLAGTSGYDASVRYVIRKARAAGFRVRRDPFEFDFFQSLAPAVLQQVSPTATDYTAGVDVAVMQYSASGDVTAATTPVDVVLAPPRSPTTSGCEGAFVEGPDGTPIPNTTGVDDFAGFPAGSIALIQRGTCSFEVKALNAQEAGAVGVIIFNQGNAPDRMDLLAPDVSGTLGGSNFTIPVVFVTFAVGEDLATPSGTVVHVTTETIAEERTTHNVIAETRRGNRSKVVVVGAHLDSVQSGPGINDNGSGSGTLLEIVEQMEGVKTRNKVRFIWFGAEEAGLLGSEAYVADLSAGQLRRIKLMLNFDMIGSPNFVRFVYDGDNSLNDPDASAGPPGSEKIEMVFTDYFDRVGLAHEPTPFNGRSDYGPFIAAGIPAGGLFTGAEGIKTPEQAAIYGGTAGLAYDPCYHQACDTFAGTGGATAPGLALVALDEMSDATAHAVITYAKKKRLP